jgi:hypothetical protein
MRWANRQSSWLSHGLLRSGGVSEPEGPTSLEGRAGGDPGVVREGVGEVGSVVAVLSASGVVSLVVFFFSSLLLPLMV